MDWWWTKKCGVALQVNVITIICTESTNTTLNSAMLGGRGLWCLTPFSTIFQLYRHGLPCWNNTYD